MNHNNHLICSNCELPIGVVSKEYNALSQIPWVANWDNTCIHCGHKYELQNNVEIGESFHVFPGCYDFFEMSDSKSIFSGFFIRKKKNENFHDNTIFLSLTELEYAIAHFLNHEGGILLHPISTLISKKIVHEFDFINPSLKQPRFLKEYYTEKDFEEGYLPGRSVCYRYLEVKLGCFSKVCHILVFEKEHNQPEKVFSITLTEIQIMELQKYLRKHHYLFAQMKDGWQDLT
jgi:hypothetical protein